MFLVVVLIDHSKTVSPSFLQIQTGGQVIQTSVDGYSYDDAPTVKTAFEMSGGLTATTVHVYEPDRSNRFWGKSRVSLESVLGTILDPQDMSLTARKHNGFGSGFKVKALERLIFKENADYKHALPVRAMPRGVVSVFRNIGMMTTDFLGEICFYPRSKDPFCFESPRHGYCMDSEQQGASAKRIIENAGGHKKPITSALDTLRQIFTIQERVRVGDASSFPASSSSYYYTNGCRDDAACGSHACLGVHGQGPNLRQLP